MSLSTTTNGDKNGLHNTLPKETPPKPVSEVTKPVKPATKPISVAPENSPKNDPESEAKKPDWLAELSRKQANRRSGLFTTTTNNNEDKTPIAGKFLFFPSFEIIS